MICFLLMRLVNDFDQYAESTQCQDITYKLISARLEKAAKVTSHGYEIKLYHYFGQLMNMYHSFPVLNRKTSKTPNAAINVLKLM